MKQWIVKNFKDFLIIALLIVLIVKNFGKPVNPQPVVVTKVDTVIIKHDSTVYSKPTIISKTFPVETQIPGNWMPKANYDSLKQQYIDSLKAYYATVVQADTLKIDTLGTVSVLDTISHNEILARKWDYNIKERLITKTTTIYPREKRQVYVGLETGLGSIGTVQSASIGALYKDRKDNIIGGAVGYNIPSSSLIYNLKYYKIIKLGRK